MLQALANRGWAERRTADPDAYHNAFTITDAGRAAVGRAMPAEETSPDPLAGFNPATGLPLSEDPADEVPGHIAEASADTVHPDDYGTVEADGYGESDIPGTEDPPEPGMVFDHELLVWVEPTEGDDIPAPEEGRDAEAAAAADTALTGAPEPDGDDTPSAPAEANDTAPVAPKAPTRRGTDREAIVAAIEALIPFATLDIRHLEGKDDGTIVTGINDTIIRAGDIRRAQNAIASLSGILDYRPAPRRTSEPKAPRNGTKQELVIAMLRRPEGATIAQMVEATGWAQHTCRGALAGTLKKKLGLNVVSEKPDGTIERRYRIEG